MSIWIITTGNSDVILKHDRNWENFQKKIRDNLEYTQSFKLSKIKENDKQAGYNAPARVLGLTYENQPDFYDSDLNFPLFNTFSNYFEDNNIKLDKVIVLLTNQENIFSSDQRTTETIPYWQDTHTLKPIIEWYFSAKSMFNLKPYFLELSPTSGQGLDHWNETFSLVNNILANIEYDPSRYVYVSHQAGTPAISSAVQFVSLNRFEKVKFILSNQFYDITYNQQNQVEEFEYPHEFKSQTIEFTQQSKPEEVNSKDSESWRGIQISKAKQLITSGFPGAALEMLNSIERIDRETLNSLKEMVDLFNLHSVDKDSSKDFEIDNASQRIVDSLELIEFFFNQNNYLQGISLLAAAQETFLKVTILCETDKIEEQYRGVPVSKLLHWNNQGLSLIDEDSLKNKLKLSNNYNLKKLKQDILKLLNFPIDKEFSKKTFQNSAMLAWVGNLRPDLEIWSNLKWSCTDKRDYESDLRNQLMHNLRGVEDSDVIEYLLGYEKAPNISNVIEAYNGLVKEPFLKAVELLKLPYERTKLHKELQAIASKIT